MSDAISTSYGRADLSQDVANTIEEMGSLNFAQALRDFYPSRNLTPREYAKNHLLKLRVKFVYVGLGEVIPDKCPQGWDLLVICGVAFTRNELEELNEQMGQMETGERVLLGLPLTMVNAVAQLRELCALRLLSQQEMYEPNTMQGTGLLLRRKFVRKQLADRARKSLSPSAFSWVYKGEIIAESPTETRDAFVSNFLQTLYSSSPRINLGCSPVHYREALDELLELECPLQVSNVNSNGTVKVLRRFMINTGIFVTVEDQGGYSRYKIAEYVSNSEWGAIWNLCIEKLIGDGSANKVTKLSDFSNALLQAPWGISRPVQALLLAAAMRRANHNLSFELNGEVMEMSGQALLRALASPGEWCVCYKPATPQEMSFLAQVRDIFTLYQSSMGGAFVNVWDRSLRCITAWYLALSGVAKFNRDTMSPDTQRFVELITDVEKREHPREMLSVLIPELCGESDISQKEVQERVLTWLSERCAELENRVEAFYSNLYLTLGEVVGAETSEKNVKAEWLDAAYRAWLNRLHAGSAISEVSEMAKAVRSACVYDGEAEQRWLSALPKSLGMPVVSAWTRDMTPLYKARFAKACVELETWSIRKTMPLSEDEGQRSGEVAAWLSGMFDGMRLSKEQRESVLLDMIEELM